MSDLQLGLIVIGVLIVVAVYGYNRYQELQLRRKVESRFAQRPEDVLMHEAHAEAPAAAEERIEPSFGESGSQVEVPEAQRDVDAAARADPVGERRAHEAAASHAAAGVSASAASAAAASATAAAAAEPESEMPVRAAATPGIAASEGAAPEPGLALESPIDYICSVEAAQPFGRANVEAFLKAANSIGKPVLVCGWNAHATEWQALPGTRDDAIERLQVVLQLADRGGAVNRVQLSSLRDLCHALAASTDGSCRCGDIDQAAHRAAEIDRFCSQVDVSVGCNVVPRSGALTGTKLRGLLESAGFTLEASGRFVLRAEDGQALLVAEDINGEPFSPERLRSTPVAGVTLNLDVPRVAGGVRAFERMLDIARHLAHALDAVVVDDNRAELNENGLKVIRQHLRTVHAAMEAQGIPAGSPLALRLFS